MSGYFNLPGVPETAFVFYSDWLGYTKDDGTIGFLLQNGVPSGGAWSTITGKPTTFPPVIGVTASTAKAGNYSPTWNEINAVIPSTATFRPTIGSTYNTAKAGNYVPDWSELTGTPTTLVGYGITDAITQNQLNTAIAPYATHDFLVQQLQTYAQIGYVMNYTPRTVFDENKDDVLAALDTKFDIPVGSSSQYLAGDGTVASFPVPDPVVSTYGPRSLNTAYQLSTTRTALVSYSVSLEITASISGGQSGDVILEVASDSGFTSNVQTVAIFGHSQTYSLALTLSGTSVNTGCLNGVVPIGYYVRLRTVNNVGTPVFTLRSTQETLL